MSSKIANFGISGSPMQPLLHNKVELQRGVKIRCGVWVANTFLKTHTILQHKWTNYYYRQNVRCPWTNDERWNVTPHITFTKAAPIKS